MYVSFYSPVRDTETQFCKTAAMGRREEVANAERICFCVRSDTC